MGSETPVDPSILSIVERAKAAGSKPGDNAGGGVVESGRPPNPDLVIEALMQNSELKSALDSVHKAQHDLGIALNQATGEEIEGVVRRMQRLMPQASAGTPAFHEGAYGALRINPDWNLPLHRLTKGEGPEEVQRGRVSDLRGYGDERIVRMSNGHTVSWRINSTQSGCRIEGYIQREVGGQEQGEYKILPTSVADERARSFIIGELTAQISLQAISAVLSNDLNKLNKLAADLIEVRATIASVPVAETRTTPIPVEAPLGAATQVAAVPEVAQPKKELRFKVADPRLAIALNTVNELAQTSNLPYVETIIQAFIDGGNGVFHLSNVANKIQALRFWELLKTDPENNQRRIAIQKEGLTDPLLRHINSMSILNEEESRRYKVTAQMVGELLMNDMVAQRIAQMKSDGTLKGTEWQNLGFLDDGLPVRAGFRNLAEQVFYDTYGISFASANKTNHDDAVGKIETITTSLLTEFGQIHDRVSNAVTTTPGGASSGGGTSANGMGKMMRY